MTKKKKQQGQTQTPTIKHGRVLLLYIEPHRMAFNNNHDFDMRLINIYYYCFQLLIFFFVGYHCFWRVLHTLLSSLNFHWAFLEMVIMVMVVAVEQHWAIDCSCLIWSMRWFRHFIFDLYSVLRAGNIRIPYRHIYCSMNVGEWKYCAPHHLLFAVGFALCIHGI